MDILKHTEISMAPVACLDEDAEPCERVDTCPTISMWRRLEGVINEFFEGITLADLRDGVLDEQGAEKEEQAAAGVTARKI